MPAEYAQLQQLVNWAQSNQSPPNFPCLPTPHPPHLIFQLPIPPLPTSAPVSHSYQSFHTQAHQAHPTVSSSHPALQSLPTSEPFLGLSSLGASLTGQVNQQRLASSAATQLRLPQLPSHGHWCQRPAIWPPQLPHTPKFEDCVSNITCEPFIQLVVKVYPPQVSAFNKVHSGALFYWFNHENLFHYRYLCDSFTVWLEKVDLYYTFNLLSSTTVVTLIEQVTSRMGASDSNFSFTSTPHFCQTRHYLYNCLGIKVSHDPLTCKFDYARWLCLQALPSVTSSLIVFSSQ